MTIALSWKVAGAAVGLVAAGLVWNGVSQSLASRHADEMIQASARAAAINAQRAQAQSQRSHDELAAKLRQQRAELASNYQQIAGQAREYRVKRTVQLGQELQEMQRVDDSYLLDKNQQCTNGTVINRRGSSFTQPVGKDGQPIRCKGNKAAQPLR